VSLEALPLTFHHLGVACRSLDTEAAAWTALGYVAEGPDFTDPIQQVSGRFLVGQGPRLELLVAAGPDSPIPAMLARGVKIYHQAYETPDFDGVLAALRARRWKVTVGPVPAIAFGGRRIAFLMNASMNLVEIIEAAS
jgi:methylmalonyl-CoA/ethylmalonyl-CoA epimerase